MKNKQAVSVLFPVLFLAILICFSSCFKNLPDKTQVYFNSFDNNQQNSLHIYGASGLIDSTKIFPFNGSKVLGPFNNNRIELKLTGLPRHNVVKVEFDLYIHDKWDGDHLMPGTTIPDAWQMSIDNYPFYLTTFSNSSYGQSFPGNYKTGAASNPAHANAWKIDMPGLCALKDVANGSSLYKIEVITSHNSDSLLMACNDALQPFNSYCLKSWSIDNLRVTAIYNY